MEAGWGRQALGRGAGYLGDSVVAVGLVNLVLLLHRNLCAPGGHDWSTVRDSCAVQCVRYVLEVGGCICFLQLQGVRFGRWWVEVSIDHQGREAPDVRINNNTWV